MKVYFNDVAIEASRNRYAGFFLILTTKFKDLLEALSVYRKRNIIEKCFDDLKNYLDARRLRVHTPERMRNRLFMQFIALIFMSRIRKAIQDKLPDGGYSAKKLLQELDSLTTTYHTGRYKDRLSEISKVQREILQAFDIDPHALLQNYREFR